MSCLFSRSSGSACCSIHFLFGTCQCQLKTFFSTLSDCQIIQCKAQDWRFLLKRNVFFIGLPTSLLSFPLLSLCTHKRKLESQQYTQHIAANTGNPPPPLHLSPFPISLRHTQLHFFVACGFAFSIWYFNTAKKTLKYFVAAVASPT